MEILQMRLDEPFIRDRCCHSLTMPLSSLITAVAPSTSCMLIKAKPRD